MKITGQLTKMISEYKDPVRYYLNFPSGFVEMNQLIGKDIGLEHISNQCLNCGLDKPIYRMGYCKSCFFIVPQTNESIIRPELSKAHLGEEETDLEWEKKFQLQPHVVYLALSGGLKVGVTREKQIPTRWIDQGATQTTVMAKTENRYQAGLVEVALKEHVADKTNYRLMLTNQNPSVDLLQTKHELEKYLPNKSEFCADDKIWEINYPVEEYPVKIKTVNLSKTPIFKGKLKGIKGQYLIFENGQVLNVRSHEGFVVDMEIA